MMVRTSWKIAVLALLLGVSGCGRSGLVTATGRVTYKGQPVPSTRVVFMPDDGGRRSTGTTDDDGKFELKFSRTAVGVMRGSHAVFLTYEVSAEEETHQIPPKASKELKAVIAKYGDPKTSGLHFEVTKNGEFFDIQLP
jgi:hypothetical protein